jgi:hypothetical protein
MDPEFNKFLLNERKRVFEPDVRFSGRVMARLGEREHRTIGFWDIPPVVARPIFALALMLLVVFLTLEAFVPVAPTRSAVEAFLEPEQSNAENVLYTDSDTLPNHEVFEQLIVFEETDR